METLAKLQKRLAAGVVLAPDAANVARHLKDFIEVAPASVEVLGLAYPRSTADVSQILRICHEDGVPVTPQGGMTGLVGGGVPIVPSIVLSLERMRAIEELDPAAATITVQAGTVLETVQNAADEAGFLFPLDLGGRGSCQIGGNASTNAGGNRVLRYGMMRDLVLGMEAVLADGTVITALNKMIKNNAGYDLKHLFIGSEGTLGVITRLVLKLHPKPVSVSTGIVALKDYQGVVELLRRARAGFGGTLSAFEAMWPEFYHLGTTRARQHAADRAHAWALCAHGNDGQRSCGRPSPLRDRYRRGDRRRRRGRRGGGAVGQRDARVLGDSRLPGRIPAGSLAASQLRHQHSDGGDRRLRRPVP